jgi:hypothetical protein
MNNLTQYNKNSAHRKLLQTIVKIDGAYAGATMRAYRSNFMKFIDYCELVGTDALPLRLRRSRLSWNNLLRKSINRRRSGRWWRLLRVSIP